MKLNEIKLLREAYREDISRDEAWEILRRNCSDALKTFDKPIVRGMTKGADYQVITGEDGGRKSANTSNYYTVIMDAVLPKEFPRRSKSIICSSFFNRSHSEGFGTMYALFPFNGVAVGICPDYDMWRTIITIGDRSRDIHEWNDIFDAIGTPDTSYSDIVDHLKYVQAHLEEYPPYAHEMLKGVDDIDKVLRQEYTQQFEVTTTANPTYNGDGTELWISGKCVAIRWPEYEKMKEELKHEAE